MERVNSILIHDETESSLQELDQKKKNRPKRRLKNILLTLLVLLIVGGIYFISDLSKVKSLKIVGNYYFDDKEILEMAELSYESRHLLVFPSKHKEKLKANKLIKEVNIDKSLSGVIVIEVQEEDIIGTYVDKKKTYLLLGDGSGVELKDKKLERIVKFPLIGSFNKEQRVELAKAFMKKDKAVEKEVLALISEIHPHQESYDKNMVELIMQDGNRIYTDYHSMYYLNKYKLMLKELKEDNVCIAMDSFTESYVKEDCKAFQ